KIGCIQSWRGPLCHSPAAPLEASLNIREIHEHDIEAVIELFRKNYGDDYAIPEFYDPQWVKRGIYSDHIIWLVNEEDGRIVASGACIDRKSTRLNSSH